MVTNTGLTLFTAKTNLLFPPITIDRTCLAFPITYRPDEAGAMASKTCAFLFFSTRPTPASALGVSTLASYSTPPVKRLPIGYFYLPAHFHDYSKRINTGKSPSKYLTQIRIDKACNLLLYTDTSIDTIVTPCGFTDRYHLTKVFSKTKKILPAVFRKKVGYY